MARTLSPLDPRMPRQTKRPERLVGVSFRRAYSSLAAGDKVARAFTHHEFCDAAGPAAADRLLDGICRFAGAIHRSAGRNIETLPPGCPGFCRDECLAISIVAASQHGACPTLRACAFALLESSVIDLTIDEAGRFARDLTAAGQTLSLDSVCNAVALTAPLARRPS